MRKCKNLEVWKFIKVQKCESLKVGKEESVEISATFLLQSGGKTEVAQKWKGEGGEIWKFFSSFFFVFPHFETSKLPHFHTSVLSHFLTSTLSHLFMFKKMYIRYFIV